MYELMDSSNDVKLTHVFFFFFVRDALKSRSKELELDVYVGDLEYL